MSLELINKSLRLTEEELEKMATFLNYTFTKVLRLNKYFMLFDTFESPCTYFIVPTMKGIQYGMRLREFIRIFRIIKRVWI